MPADLIAKSKAEVEASREARGRYTAGEWSVVQQLACTNPNMGAWGVEGRTNVANHCTLADATLIAAAPDLLEALAYFVGQYDAFRVTSGNQADAYYALVKGKDARWEAARAAIAKATPLSEQMVEDKGREG